MRPQQRSRRGRVRLQVLCDGGGRDGLQGDADEEKGQTEEDCGQDNRVAGGMVPCFHKRKNIQIVVRV